MSILWRHRGAALVTLLLALALLLAFLVAKGSSNHKPASHTSAEDSNSSRTTSPRAPGVPPGYARLDAGLAQGVDAAAALGGEVEAAAMLDGWSEPAVETSETRGDAREMRLWSMSKVPTMIALLRLLGWGERPGKPTSAELDAALEGAIERSENCHQRRVVLELEHAAGGSAAARAALADTFGRAGAQVQVADQAEAPESVCLPYLETQVDIAEPLSPALLLGTSRWRIGDAVKLAHALAVGTYGKAVSGRVLGLMREPKLVSREIPPGELTAPLDWGAGNVFAGLEPAYKAGWGGSLNGNFLAGQIAVVPLPGGDHLSLAAVFHPDTQPSRDDPGITTAPQAIGLIMESLREAAGAR